MTNKELKQLNLKPIDYIGLLIKLGFKTIGEVKSFTDSKN